MDTSNETGAWAESGGTRVLVLDGMGRIGLGGWGGGLVACVVGSLVVAAFGPAEVAFDPGVLEVAIVTAIAVLGAALAGASARSAGWPGAAAAGAITGVLSWLFLLGPLATLHVQAWTVDPPADDATLVRLVFDSYLISASIAVIGLAVALWAGGAIAAAVAVACGAPMARPKGLFLLAPGLTIGGVHALLYALVVIGGTGESAKSFGLPRPPQAAHSFVSVPSLLVMAWFAAFFLVTIPLHASRAFGQRWSVALVPRLTLWAMPIVCVLAPILAVMSAGTWFTLEAFVGTAALGAGVVVAGIASKWVRPAAFSDEVGVADVAGVTAILAAAWIAQQGGAAFHDVILGGLTATLPVLGGSADPPDRGAMVQSLLLANAWNQSGRAAFAGLAFALATGAHAAIERARRAE